MSFDFPTWWVTIPLVGGMVAATVGETFPEVDRQLMGPCAVATEVAASEPSGDVFFISGAMDKFRNCKPQKDGIHAYATSLSSPMEPSRGLRVIVRESYRTPGEMVPRPLGLQNFGPWQIDVPPWEESIIRVYVETKTPFGTVFLEEFAEFTYHREGAPDG